MTLGARAEVADGAEAPERWLSSIAGDARSRAGDWPSGDAMKSWSCGVASARGEPCIAACAAVSDRPRPKLRLARGAAAPEGASRASSVSLKGSDATVIRGTLALTLGLSRAVKALRGPATEGGALEVAGAEAGDTLFARASPGPELIKLRAAVGRTAAAAAAERPALAEAARGGSVAPEAG